MGIPLKGENGRKNNNIDLEVLNELPEDLRIEIMNEYNLNQGTIISQIKSQKKGEHDFQAPQVQIVKKYSKNMKNKSLFEGLSWEELKEALKTWLASEAEPLEFDINLISAYFRQLAITREIEYLKVIFSFLHRNLAKMNCKWHQAYLSMVNVMQQGMVARYGATLMVQRKFQCCW